MKALGLTLSATVFTTPSSQKSAVKAGHQEVSSVSFEEIQKAFPDFDFSHASGSYCKTFILET